MQMPHLPYICAADASAGDAIAAAASNATTAAPAIYTTMMNSTAGVSSLAEHCTGYSGYTVKLVLDAAELGLILCAIGLIESLMTLKLVDQILDTPGSNFRECLGQGFANILSGLFASMGGCAIVGESLLNIRGGSKLRYGGVVCALVILAAVLFAEPLIELIPLGVLVGLIFSVVLETFDVRTFEYFFVLPVADSLIIVVVTALAVATNLAYAVGAGIMLQALFFSWKASTTVECVSKTCYVDTKTRKATVCYTITGPIFFASSDIFLDIFKNVEMEPTDVVIRLGTGAHILDSTGLEALDNLGERLKKLKKKGRVYFDKTTRNTLQRNSSFLRQMECTAHGEPDWCCNGCCNRPRRALCGCYRGYIRAKNKSGDWMLATRRRCCFRMWSGCCKPCPCGAGCSEKLFGERGSDPSAPYTCKGYDGQSFQQQEPVLAAGFRASMTAISECKKEE